MFEIHRRYICALLQQKVWTHWTSVARRVIPDIEIREAVINACGLRSISDFQLLTLERRKSVIVFAVVAVLQFQNRFYDSQKLTLYLYINIEVFLGYGKSLSRTATLQRAQILSWSLKKTENSLPKIRRPQ